MRERRRCSEIKTGDQVRALGAKSEDGAKMTAEEIVSGSFREIAATIISIDAAKGEMRVNDLATKKPVTVKVGAESSLKKLPPQMAQMLAARNRPPEEGAGRAGGAAPEGRGGGRGFGGRGGGGDLTQMLDRLPAVTLADLNKGDAIILLSTVGAAPDQLNVITMLAGCGTHSDQASARGKCNWDRGAWAAGSAASHKNRECDSRKLWNDLYTAGVFLVLPGAADRRGGGDGAGSGQLARNDYRSVRRGRPQGDGDGDGRE